MHPRQARQSPRASAPARVDAPRRLCAFFRTQLDRRGPSSRGVDRVCALGGDWARRGGGVRGRVVAVRGRRTRLVRRQGARHAGVDHRPRIPGGQLADAIAEAYPKAFARTAATAVSAPPEAVPEEDLRADPPWTAREPEIIGEVAAGCNRTGIFRVGGDLMASREAIAKLETDLGALFTSARRGNRAPGAGSVHRTRCGHRRGSFARQYRRRRRPGVVRNAPVEPSTTSQSVCWARARSACGCCRRSDRTPSSA